MFGACKQRSMNCLSYCAALALVLVASHRSPAVTEESPRPDSCSAGSLPEDCAGRSLEYLRRTMDRYHAEKFWVYEDADAAGNHFVVWPSYVPEGQATNCPVVIHGDTRDASPGCSLSCGGDAVESSHVEWRRYNAPGDGEATFSLDAGFDSILSIHRGCPGPGQEKLKCSSTSQITLSMTMGESYLIRIAGVGAAAGPYTLTIDGPEAPGAPPILNCDVSVEFDAFTTHIYDQDPPCPIHAGATAIEFRFNYTHEADWGSLGMNNGVFDVIGLGGTLTPNHGYDECAGVNLTGVTALKFHARGEKGGEKVTFLVGGVGWRDNEQDPTVPFPDSTKNKIDTELGTVWTPYEISLKGANLSHVIRGFGWATRAQDDPDFDKPESDDAVIFYVDDIYFEFDENTTGERLAGTPRFLQSFTTIYLPRVYDPVLGDFDHRFRAVAFIYDDALALLAFLAEGTPDGFRRARLIGDAFVYAATHDRKFCDGRLRSAYSAGDLTLPPGWIPNGVGGEVRLPGFWNTQCQEFQQLFHDNISTGNTAWAMTALLALYRETCEQEACDNRFLLAARGLGEFIRRFRDDSCEDETGQKVGGFTGGIKNIEAPVPDLEPFSSAEHNIDVAAAFMMMYEITGEQSWLEDAEHARRFVRSLWGGDEFECLYTGRGQDCGLDTAYVHLALDVQAWAALGIPSTFKTFPEVLQCALRHHLTKADGFEGFDFNTDRDGVWFEGTAHMATAFASVGQMCLAQRFRRELCRAQDELPSRGALPPLFRDPIGLVAGSHDGITTGFDFEIFQRLHLGATAWNVFAQLGWNPYWQFRSVGPDADGDGDVDLDDFVGWEACFTGPTGSSLDKVCEVFDIDENATVDLADFAEFQCSR